MLEKLVDRGEEQGAAVTVACSMVGGEGGLHGGDDPDPAVNDAHPLDWTGRNRRGPLTSLIAGAATFVWCFALHVPFALLLGAFVAIVDPFPYRSTVGGFVVALVALAVSIPVSIATVGFYIAFRLAEDYLLTPRIIGRAVKVPGGVTVVPSSSVRQC